MTGVVVWITGLPSSGKSTLARQCNDALLARGVRACILDGDEVRASLVPRPGYTELDRAQFYESLANLAAMLARQSLIVLVPATAHRRAYRQRARSLAPAFLEVWVPTSIAECERRDAKGLYAKVRAGELRGVPGADEHFEEPEAPEVVASTGDSTVIEAICAKALRAHDRE